VVLFFAVIPTEAARFHLSALHSGASGRAVKGPGNQCFITTSSLRPLRYVPSFFTSFLFPPKYAKLISVNTIHFIPKFPEADEPCT
jgi:hypothetical protein